MKKFILILCAALLTFSLFACKNSDKYDYSVPETSGEPETTEKENKTSLELPTSEFTFSSGAGGWATFLTLCDDGTFFGEYFDGNLGEWDEDKYPNGTVYTSIFRGKYEISEQINDYSCRILFTNIETEETPGNEWIEDGRRYIASPPFGVLEDEYILYTPSSPVSELPEVLTMWTHGMLEGKDLMGAYALFHESEGVAFFTQLN